jgi:hypothetical protein
MWEVLWYVEIICVRHGVFAASWFCRVCGMLHLRQGCWASSAKLYTMQLALADELVSIPVNSCFLHQILLQGGLFGVLVSAFCWDVWSWRCCSRSSPLWLCLLLLFISTWTTLIRYGRSSNACYSGDGRYVTLWSKTRESRKAVKCSCNPLRINTTPLSFKLLLLRFLCNLIDLYM